MPVPLNIVEIQAAADRLRPGETCRLVCPECNDPERSLAITRREFHEAAYVCFRNSCGIKGYVYVQPGAAAPEPHTLPKPEGFSGFSGTLWGLQWTRALALAERFDLEVEDIPGHILDAGYPWLALPIRDAERTLTAYQLRWSWLEPNPPIPKTKLFLEGSRRTLAWYPPRAAWKPERVLLVEDCMSALRASRHADITAAALLGTQLTAAHVQELHAAGTAHVVLALDPDALEKAFELAKQWGPAFRSFRVLAIEDDIKDLPLAKLKRLLASI